MGQFSTSNNHNYGRFESADRLKPSDREGKMLTDLEEKHELTCLINQPTRVPTTSQTLLDVTLDVLTLLTP